MSPLVTERGDEVQHRRVRTHLMRGLRLVIERIPPVAGNFIADRLGDLVYSCARRSRQAAISNIRHVRRGASRRVIKRDARGVFRNVMRDYYELCRGPALSDEQIESMVSFDERGWGRIAEFHRQKRSVILVSAHFGAFDVLTQVLSRREPHLTVMAAQVKPAWLSDFVIDLRAGRGIDVVLVDEEEGSGLNIGALKRSVRLLRRGELLGVLADRNMEQQGVHIPFFGYDTVVAAGVAKMALRTNSAVVPGFCRRMPGKRYEVTFDEPIEPRGSASNENDLRVLLSQIFARFEYYIGRNPEQWVLLQPVWPK